MSVFTVQEKYKVAGFRFALGLVQLAVQPGPRRGALAVVTDVPPIAIFPVLDVVVPAVTVS